MGNAIAQPLQDAFSQAFASQGPIGGILGGFLGAAVGGLISKAFGGGRRARDGQTPATATFMHMVNPGDVGAELLKQVQAGLLAGSGARQDTLSGQLRAGNIGNEIRMVAI